MHIQDHIPTKKTLSKQRSFNYSKLSFYFLTTSVSILILLQIQALNLKHFLPFSLPSKWSSTLPHWHQKADKNLGFFPLKDLRFANTAMEGNTWFMSSLNNMFEDGVPEHLLFPSKESSGQLLCISGNDMSNGTRNLYALTPPDSLPPDAKVLPGLTIVSDTYYDFENLYHGLTAIVPFIAWHEKKDCVKPSRFVLFHWGELRKRMSPWVGSLVEAVFGEKNVNIEKFDEGRSKVSCFEKAVVFRHNEGNMSGERKVEIYGMIRCKARAYCNVSREVGDEKAIRLTLLLRTGTRSFKDEAAVVRIFESECKKVDGCRVKVARPNNLTFCEQVKLMSSTDILASTHGAQLTNMFFMDKQSSVMEFFPKGWLELAGPGQYAHHWLAISSGMRHKGAWRDPNGEPCPYSDSQAKCFSFYKDGRIGYDEKYFAKWAADVINEMRVYKLSEEYLTVRQRENSNSCQCM